MSAEEAAALPGGSESLDVSSCDCALAAFWLKLNTSIPWNPGHGEGVGGES